jgi:hypothetical protein|tara:strand:- start:304 stop:462 length:159 start_codon:yes stop_codon:yes gene_type:complete
VEKKMVKNTTKIKKKPIPKAQKAKKPMIEPQNAKIGIAMGVILILLMLMANT